MTSSLTGAICKSCDEPITVNTSCACKPSSQPRVHIPQDVVNSIYNCNKCNTTPFTFYKCKCDMGKQPPKVSVIQSSSSKISEDDEEERFGSIFKLDDEEFTIPPPPNYPPPDDDFISQRRNAMVPDPLPTKSSPIIDSDDLPPNFLSRIQEINNLFENSQSTQNDK